MFSRTLMILKCGHFSEGISQRQLCRPESDPSSVVFICHCGVWSAYGFGVCSEHEQVAQATSTSKLRADLASYVLSQMMDNTPFVRPSYACEFCIWGIDNTDVFFDYDEKKRLREVHREERKREREERSESKAVDDMPTSLDTHPL